MSSKKSICFLNVLDDHYFIGKMKTRVVEYKTIELLQSNIIKKFDLLSLSNAHLQMRLVTKEAKKRKTSHRTCTRVEEKNRLKQKQVNRTKIQSEPK